MENHLKYRFVFAEQVKNDIVKWIRCWFNENGKDCKAVVGLSGGKDSNVVATLCVEALGKDRVIGVTMPNSNSQDMEDIKRLVNHLGIELITIPISFSYYNILDELENAFENKRNITEQTKINLAPRLRMSILYAVSQSVNGRVANTCNWSEEYVGYSTRFGDGGTGDFSPLGALTVTEILEIGKYLDIPYDLVEKTPSDGLCGKTDEENLGFTYEVLDYYIRTGICEDQEVKRKIDEKHQKNLFKLQPIPTFEIT